MSLLLVAHVSSANPSDSVTGDGTISTIEAFSSPVTFWGTGIEAVIEQAYRKCFRTYIFDDRIVTLRIPFAQNNERAAVSGTDLIIVGDGKADPLFIWNQIDEILATEDFDAYTQTLSDGRDKVIIFDLPERKWSLSRDLFDIARMKAAVYRALPHEPYVLSTGDGLFAPDIYNYLYCVGRIGMDCSGFVWYILSRTAQAGGMDLNRRFDRLLRAPPGIHPAFYVGTSLFDTESVEFIQVEDKISNLRPGDVMLFRDKDGTMAHSAVIQSVDLPAGVIRYVQCTDEAPYDERGVHDSSIRFDPTRTELSLKDKSLEWSQFRFPPFPGERPSPYSADGERYRAFPEFGGGKVIRLRAIA
ncbi:MAG: peptidoglycan endopeptidase, partial [Spirochaetales bacterium]|nr:peptidoglycan endopeptidase [Spirochaetales bacterium]